MTADKNKAFDAVRPWLQRAVANPKQGSCNEISVVENKWKLKVMDSGSEVLYRTLEFSDCLWSPQQKIQG